jgi:hypothetical protein
MDKDKWPDGYLEGDTGWLDSLYEYFGCQPYWSVEDESETLLGVTVKTGSVAPVSGVYRYVSHSGKEQGAGCMPSFDEREIPVSKGERMPPVRSCGKSARWKLVRIA